MNEESIGCQPVKTRYTWAALNKNRKRLCKLKGDLDLSNRIRIFIKYKNRT